MKNPGFAQRALAASLATLLFWGPLGPSRAAAQEVQADLPEVIEEDQARVRELPGEVSEIVEAEPGDAPADSAPPSDALTPLALPGGDTRTSVSAQAISLPTAEGSIEGMGESFTPNLSSGTGTFSVPIALAPGRAGVQPSFSLAYSTSGGNGVAGFGWNVSAPFISRQVDRGVPRYDDSELWHVGEDRFIYNGGQELVPVDSGEMARIDAQANGGVLPTRPSDVSTWQEYRARVEGGFMRFFRSRDRQRWVVLSKDGSRFDFGLTPLFPGSATTEGPADIVGTNALERDPASTARIYRWMLTRMIDAHGSPVWYRYAQHDGQAYLQDVTYVSPQTLCTPGAPAQNRACSAPLDSYASRVTFQYESRTDVFDTWVSGWRIATPRRLARVVVTAWDDVLGARALVRRYHLTYSASSYHSLLESVQVEGRREQDSPWAGVRVLGAPVAEASLGPTSALVGPTLPAMRFSYSALPVGLSNRVQAVAGSPPHSIDEARSELFDVNSDGLPDLLVTDPARYRTSGGEPASGVFFNGFAGPNATPAGRTASFSGAIPVAMPASLDGTMAWSNPNVAPMDIDGDGRGDLLHMPRLRTYGWFSPIRGASDAAEAAVAPGQQGWAWSYETIGLPPTDADPRIDLGRDGAHIQVMDVNNDHLIDVVRTAGTEIQTFLNLGWLPGGEGRFGSYFWSGSTALLSTQPVSTCLPVAGTVFDFEDPEVRLGDMNGDGLQDFVRIRRGRVIYWPGRGDGSFGIGARGCAPGIVADRHIEMAVPPLVDADLLGVSLTDIDGDGADDVVQLRFDALDVWFNRAGRSFTERTIVRDMPANPSFASRVRLVDIDGSGTVDVLYADARNWRFVDLAGGQRPRLLTGVENGLGAQTTLEYQTSAADYVRDLAACAAGGDDECFTWSQPGDPGDPASMVHRSGGSPVVSTVVRAVTTTDRMEVLGREAQRARQELAYHNGYYEGIEQEFRGFGVTDSHAIGDWNNPTTITRTWFHQGRRPQSIADDRLEHNPDESLKGREYLTETLDETGQYLSSAHATVAVRHLFDGQDGRPIDYAFVIEANEIRYDTTPFIPSYAGDSIELADVVREDVNRTTGAVTRLTTGTRMRDVPVRGQPSHAARIRSTYDEVDNLGQVRRQTAHGQVGLVGAAPIDDIIVSHSEPVLIGNWTWRTRHTWVDGPSGPLGDTTVSYDGLGDPSMTVTAVTGTPTLSFAGPDPGESVPQTVEPIRASLRRDAWGQPTVQCAGADISAGAAPTAPPTACMRFGSVVLDPHFGQLATSETAWVDRDSTHRLTTRGEWDRGLGLVLAATEPNGEQSIIRYDGFGRPVASIRPPVAGCAADLPTSLIQYELTSDPVNQPLSRVRTTTLIRNAADCSLEAPIVGLGYVDGLGRVRAALATGGDEHAWARAGITTFDAKGSVRRSYQPDFYDGADTELASVLALPTEIPYAVTRYDGFGRARGVIATDGATVWTSHHALSTDVCDPLDNDPASPHFHTCTTARSDGHGRVIDQVLRNRDPDTGALEHHHLWSWYRGDGAVLALARTQRMDSETRPVVLPSRDLTTVVRTFTYDSIGRRVTSADPDTDSRSTTRSSSDRSWRYLFNRVGDLVAVRDPRGCGQNFVYDLGGRLLGEQYVGCAEAQTSAAERPTAGVAGPSIGIGIQEAAVTVDVRYYYDRYDANLAWTARPAGLIAYTLGLPVGVEDRGQRSVVGYDRRGNVVWSARQMAFLSDALAMNTATVREDGSPLAPGDDRPHRADVAPSPSWVSYDTDHTYQRTAQFDHQGRGVAITLPLDPDYGTGAPVIAGSMTYNTRGLPATTTAHVDTAPYPIVAGIRYGRDGVVEALTWGDGRTGASPRAATVSETRYDTRRRPIRMYTHRAPTAGAPAGSLGAVSGVVDQELVWDAASNLTDIVDHRDGSEWPLGFRPRTTHVDHDSLYRVVGAFFEYTQTDNRRTTQDDSSDYRATLDLINRPNGAASNAAESTDPMYTVPAPMVPVRPADRAVSLTWDWDFLGNSTEWTDDQNSFYERSIGEIHNGLEASTGRPSALTFATNIDAPLTAREGGAGWVEVDYGEGGNVLSMTVHGQCGPAIAVPSCTQGSGDTNARRTSLRATCACVTEQHYAYRWDELNRLSEGRRWDRDDTVPGAPWALQVRQRSQYDGANVRTLKQTVEPMGGEGAQGPGAAQERIALYVLPGDYERRGLRRTEDSYAPGPFGTETQYLVAGARMVWRDAAAAELEDRQNRRITVALADVIQTTAATLDVLTGELVEASTYYPNGAREAFLADAADPSAAEVAGFTGKEADEEVGLTYFGERHMIAGIGRWATPDPLHVERAGGGESLNAYHYAAGMVIQKRDPLGLLVADGDAVRASYDQAEAAGWTEETASQVINALDEFYGLEPNRHRLRDYALDAVEVRAMIMINQHTDPDIVAAFDRGDYLDAISRVGSSVLNFSAAAIQSFGIVSVLGNTLRETVHNWVETLVVSGLLGWALRTFGIRATGDSLAIRGTSGGRGTCAAEAAAAYRSRSTLSTVLEAETTSIIEQHGVPEYGAAARTPLQSLNNAVSAARSWFRRLGVSLTGEPYGRVVTEDGAAMRGGVRVSTESGTLIDGDYIGFHGHPTDGGHAIYMQIRGGVSQVWDGGRMIGGVEQVAERPLLHFYRVGAQE